MKYMILFLLSILSLSAFAINESQVDRILKSRGLSVAKVQQNNMNVILGENTGHIPFAKIKIIITSQEAILKNEIESVDMSGSTVAGIKSVRFNGGYILKSDIEAVVSEK